jgi:hypothetical protein
MKKLLACAVSTALLGVALSHSLVVRAENSAAPSTRPAASGAVMDAGVEKLAKQLEGAFASTKQSKTDLSYWDIRLHMVRVWADRTDGIWLYVEQARADMLDQPYRQRCYRVYRREDGQLVSAVYNMSPELGEKLANVWKGDVNAAFKGLSPSDLTLKAGCEMLLNEQADGTYKGGTDGKKCLSDHAGATYATSEATITPKGLRTWDRGYDDTDKQVWGAKKGPYIFDRQD